ncbi:MAG TPA: HAD hydrolase-like protein [Anaeromyxobacteraceae bacterium]|nr:HAD hydrolase-like protein [Anaeromyxobacteraceae bacterium]
MPTLRPMAVLLDLDGTLLDTVQFILDSVSYAFAGRTRRPTEAEWLAHIGTPLRVLLTHYTDGPEDLEQVTTRYRAYQREHHDLRTRPYAGAVEAVRALKERGHPVAIVTGKGRESAGRALACVGLTPFVDAIIGADSCPGHKPDPEPVLLALERVGRAPEEAVFMGDSVLDVLSGNAAGVPTVAALWGASEREALEQAGPGFLLEDVSELPELVERLERTRAG